MKTVFVSPKQVERKWWLVDAEGLVLGRLATIIANRIRGKHKPYYTPNIDCGDYVVVINAEKIAITGKKETDKVYYRHTGYPGGIKETTPEKLRGGNYPERILKKAVERMLSRNRHPLQASNLGKLKVYKGSKHPHEAQKLEILDVASMNKKNKKRG